MSRKHLDVDLFDGHFLADPYAVYSEIRAVGNVVWNDLLHGWMAVGYDEVVSVRVDAGVRFANAASDLSKTPWFEAPNMITVEGDYHRRLRTALAPMFTRSAIATWERRVAEVVGELLEPLVSGNDRFDLIADFTKLPTIIVAEMLGVPEERHADFMRWSHSIVTNLSWGLDDARQAASAQASRELNDFMQDELERHRREPADDLLTAMLALEGDAAMTDGEIVSTGVLMLVAGYDTTAKTMSNCLIALEQHPDQRRMVVDDPTLLPAAIEEGMRWYGAVQGGLRTALIDSELDGEHIAAGDPVFTFTAAANRDPRRWPDADRFDITREVRSHIGFGFGTHLCLGAPLARLEVKVALEQLLRLAPEYALEDIDFGHSVFIRGPETGVVAVGSRAA